MKDKYVVEIIKEAKKAYKIGEIPVGCIIVKNGKIISKGYNLVEKKKNAINHAELIAIKKASKKLKNWRLIDCEMYVTLEPCDLCVEAIRLSRIKKVYYLLSKSKKVKKTVNLEKIDLNSNEYEDLFNDFFKKIR